ncbi:ankyrin repeat domain-containing protein [bacterium]|nr:ankyrin repeat domain-containing protein [bacterium]
MLKQETIDEQGRTELMLVVRTQCKESVKKELPNRSSDIFITDKVGHTALFYAAERGDEEIVWILLNSLTAIQRGALLEVKDNEGNLAEDWAKINSQEEIRRILSVERQRIAFYE